LLCACPRVREANGGRGVRAYTWAQQLSDRPLAQCLQDKHVPPYLQCPETSQGPEQLAAFCHPRLSRNFISSELAQREKSNKQRAVRSP
jgi:hypothetical protein